MTVWNTLLGVAAALLATWVALVVTLAVIRPRGTLLREALRLLPDVLRLTRRLAADKSLPRGVRVRLALLLAYLAFPIDLIPDFIPVLGYADDAIIVTAVLRGVARAAGSEALRRHWPGTEAGFDTLIRLTGLPTPVRKGDPPEDQPQRQRTGRPLQWERPAGLGDQNTETP
ncbi:YkvA family protein [Actinophytocola sp. NPDC049390]|uniref:YkvA family protein n=1 Tax=Actinophytocola sp. NPDC049390 TaxID=3363894 RepID=UPI0037B4B660